MAQRNVYLKRNSFLIFVLNAMPLIVFGAIISAFLYQFGRELFVLVDFIFFIGAIINGFLALVGNNRVIVFARNNVSICNVTKGAPKVIKRWVYEEIQFFYCDDKETKISVEFVNGKPYKILDFSNVPMLGKEAFFLAKAELCRYFPNKVKNLRDSNVDSYIQSGIIPNDIKRQNEAGITGANVLALIEMILGFAAIGFGVWSAYLMFTKLGTGATNSLFDLLNVIGK